MSMPHHRKTADSLNRVAFAATLHCLTGCALGEVLGLVIATWRGWSTGPAIALAVALAFLFGYAFTMIPLLKSGLPPAKVLPIALAADTFSITVMEIVDNAVMLIVPGAMTAGLDSLLFWGTLVFALGIAFIAAFPVNRYLISKGKGHALAHHRHHH